MFGFTRHSLIVSCTFLFRTFTEPSFEGKDVLKPVDERMTVYCMKTLLKLPSLLPVAV
jgi:hypothetical protein